MKTRQSAPVGIFPALWQLLTSARLSIILLVGMIGLSVVGTLIAQEGTSPIPLEKIYSPDTLYFMRLLGLTDIFHSGWFISILALIAVNLLCSAFDRIPLILNQVAQIVPPAVNADQIRKSKSSEKYVFHEFKLAVPREEFRDFVKGFVSRGIGQAHTIRDEGGLSELQIAGQENRFNRLFAYLAHLGLLLIMVGGLVGAIWGFEGQLSIDEGARVNFVKVLKGDPQGWPLLRERGRVIPGFYVPGFEVELGTFAIDFHSGTNHPKTLQSWLKFYENSRQVAAHRIAVNEPTEFKGIRFHQFGYGRTGGIVGVVTVTDRENKSKSSVQFAKGVIHRFEDAAVKVLEVEEKVEELGPAMRLEYVEQGEEAKSFWIFQNFPSYDHVSRKKARYAFSLDSTRPRFTSTISLVRDPGLKWVWLGSALLAVAIFFSLFRAHNRFWFIWLPKSILVVGWSNRMFSLEPRFEGIAEQIRARMEKLDKKKGAG